MSKRLSVLKTVLWALVGVLAVVTVARFTRGLGAVTNLSDAAPWGLWVGFDVMAGVALAAGGFVLAATVYIFGLERYKPFVRPAILTAFLGYAAVATGLLYDLGLPWNIWHPMINWQHHSVLFEVATCVMLYLTVLALEFAPVALEHPLFARPLFQKIYSILKKVTIPLVIAGIVLSTLHQSSLGSLFLITPYRLHPLWYSPIIYVLFFVSAVGLGLMMVALESLLSALFLGHKVHTRLLSGLGMAAAVVLVLYVVVRLGDLAVRGVLSSSLDGSWQSNLFIFELAVSAIIPAGLLLLKRVRTSVAGLAVCAGLVVFGMVLYRLDVCIIAFARPEGVSYFPSWMEFAVSLGIVAGGILIFIFFVEHLKVYEKEEGAALPQPSYDPATLHGLMPSSLSAPRRHALVAVIAAAVAVAFLPEEAIEGARPARTPVFAARSVEGSSFMHQDGQPCALTLMDDREKGQNDTRYLSLLMIDGNRDRNAVLFNHKGHIKRMGNHQSCSACHHLNMPLDMNTSCHECHRDMYEQTSVFSHDSHIRHLGGNDGCAKCHADPATAKTYETATVCTECHQDSIASGNLIKEPRDRWRKAAGYMDAMHGLCISCHENKVDESPRQYSPDLARCDTCHDVDRSMDIRRMAPGRQAPTNRQAVKGKE